MCSEICSSRNPWAPGSQQPPPHTYSHIHILLLSLGKPIVYFEDPQQTLLRTKDRGDPSTSPSWSQEKWLCSPELRPDQLGRSCNWHLGGRAPGCRNMRCPPTPEWCLVISTCWKSSCSVTARWTEFPDLSSHRL